MAHDFTKIANQMQDIGFDDKSISMFENCMIEFEEEYKLKTEERYNELQRAYNRELLDSLRLMREGIDTYDQLQDMIAEATEQLSDILKKKREAKKSIPVKTIEKQNDEAKQTVVEQKIYNFRL